MGFAFSGCMHTDSVAVDNRTDQALTVRVSVDRWFDAYECNTGSARGGLDRDATFSIAPGEMLCLRGESSKERYDAREHLRDLSVVRSGQRCFYGTHEQLREHLVGTTRGYTTLSVDDELCPPPERQLLVSE